MFNFQHSLPQKVKHSVVELKNNSRSDEYSVIVDYVLTLINENYHMTDIDFLNNTIFIIDHMHDANEYGIVESEAIQDCLNIVKNYRADILNSIIID